MRKMFIPDSRMQENGKDMHNAANKKIGSQSISSHFRRFPTKADLSAQ